MCGISASLWCFLLQNCWAAKIIPHSSGVRLKKDYERDFFVTKVFYKREIKSFSLFVMFMWLCVQPRFLMTSEKEMRKIFCLRFFPFWQGHTAEEEEEEEKQHLLFDVWCLEGKNGRKQKFSTLPSSNPDYIPLKIYLHYEMECYSRFTHFKNTLSLYEKKLRDVCYV